MTSLLNCIEAAPNTKAYCLIFLANSTIFIDKKNIALYDCTSWIDNKMLNGTK
ncbi:hypothetical protein D920_02264 [Enterococcus faecalis 13-SD-W-01]|nr:hypothetical protein D920_02264 [Enterococcus faecalis 13-SD-W-01]